MDICKVNLHLFKNLNFELNQILENLNPLVFSHMPSIVGSRDGNDDQSVVLLLWTRPETDRTQQLLDGLP